MEGLEKQSPEGMKELLSSGELKEVLCVDERK